MCILYSFHRRRDIRMFRIDFVSENWDKPYEVQYILSRYTVKARDDCIIRVYNIYVM